jgi:hypothetical protein
MELSQVPKTFWHALSFCMVVATLGFVFIAYRASSVSIEIANAKINLSSALATVKDIQNDLATENERLKKANEDLQAQVTKPNGDVPKVTNESPIRREYPSVRLGSKVF